MKKYDFGESLKRVLIMVWQARLLLIWKSKALHSMTLLEQLDHSKSCTHKPCRSTKGLWNPVYQYWRVWNSPLPIMFPKSFMSGIYNRGMSNALIILLVLLCIFLRLFHRFYVDILNFFAPSSDPLYLWECFVFKNVFYLTLTSSGYYLLN